MPDEARRGRDRVWYPWAVLLAVPVGCAALPLVYGLHLPRVLMLLLPLVLIAVWAVVAHGALVRAARPGGRDLLRYWAGLVAALGLALVVAVTGVAASWDKDVQARRADTTERDGWTVRFESLIAERATQQQELDRPVPDAERDETVLRLEQRYRQVTTDLEGAEHAVVCERDGTCGTKIRGAGPNYREKVGARDDLRRDFEALPGLLDKARAAVLGRAAEVDGKKPAAEAALARIKLELDELGPRRPEPPGRLEAAFSVAGDHVPSMTAGFVTVALLLVLDLLAAALVVAFRRRAERLSTGELVARQGQWDLAGDGPGGAT